MLLPHPELRLSDLLQAPSSPSLTGLIDAAGVHRCYNARAALFHIANALKATGRTTILLPAFHCPSMIQPVLRAGMRPEFFRIDRDLGIDLDDVRARLDGDVAAVVFINYLGFEARFEPILAELRARGVFVVEDCAHACVLDAPLQLAGGRADAALYSFWKLVPSWVGGGLWLAPGSPVTVPPLAHVPLRDSIRRAKKLGEQVILGLGDDHPVARAYAWAERARVRLKTRGARAPGASSKAAPPSPDGPTPPPAETHEYFFSERLARSRIPWMTERIMAHADLAALVGARRRNYEALARALEPGALVHSMRPVLPPRISPLAYPVLVPDRSSHDLRLRALGVPVWTFGSTLHRLMFEIGDRHVVDDARYLSDNMLLLSIHHMFEPQHARGFAATVNRYCAEGLSCALT